MVYCKTAVHRQSMGLEEKNFSSGGIFNDRRTFVGFETNDSVGEKRYKWSVRSELAKAKSLSL